MWHYSSPFHSHDADMERFLSQVNGSADFFAPEAPVYVARAPGRLDLMGGIADYSGSLVLEMPLAVATMVAAQLVTDPSITILSTTAAEIGGVARVTVPRESLYPTGEAIEYANAHKLLTADAHQAWAAYVVGVLVVLQRELNLVVPQGVRMMVHCEVPIGKGVSSSAALEVATMQAVCALVGKKLDGPTLAILCQKVENFVVGAPCGLMDQMTSACGEQDCLLALLCQPAKLLAPVRLPEQVEVWGIDSGVRHAVTGSDYAGVRIGAFMGYRILAEHAGMAVTPYGEQYVEVRDPLWSGYLANITPSQWEMSYRDVVPVSLAGKEFLARYLGSTDVVTRIDPERVYAVRQPTAHPIYEHHRTQLFKTLLQSSALGEEQLVLLGELMYQSHASYSACGLGASGTDRLVALVRAAGPAAGLYGAKITGGGSGGTVAVLARRGSATAIQRIVAAYEQEIGHAVMLLSGSSPGAATWGVVQLAGTNN